MNILKLTPSCKDYLWGGNRLRSDFGIKSNLNPLAERGWFPATRTAPAICRTAPPLQNTLQRTRAPWHRLREV